MSRLDEPLKRFCKNSYLVLL